jgi:pimeloyl-ACP methyl ester carboxylesterase
MKGRTYLRLALQERRWALVTSAAALGAVALLNYALARRTEKRNPPIGRFIEVDGIPLHYIERGSGPPIVFLHGNGAMAQDFDTSGLLDLAAREYRVIVFDRPGFGYSKRPRRRIWTADAQAASLHKALQQMGVQRPILVGHSWGTLVALALALAHPTDMSGLVLISGYYFPSFRSDALLSAASALPGLGDILRYTISPLLGWLMLPRVIRKLFAPSPVPIRFTSEYPTSMSLRPSQLRAAAGDTALMVPAAAQFAPRFGEIAMPVAILAGGGDKIVDVDHQAKRLHSAIPGSTLQVAEGVGHMLHHMVPQPVMEAIRRINRDEIRVAAE